MMIKISRKILPIFILTAILVIAGGFSDGMNAQAKTFSMADRMYLPSETMHIISNSGSVLHQEMPTDNALKPCCENKQGGASAIQGSVFNQDAKISSFVFIENILDNNSVFKYKISQLSSASPPRPDVLSSILKKE